MKEAKAAEEERKNAEGWGKNRHPVQTLKLGSYHGRSHVKLPPSPVPWIIHGALSDMCDVTRRQATYQALSIAKITADKFETMEGFS